MTAGASGMLSRVEASDLQHLNLARETVTLAVSAASWLDDAMKCWAAGDYAKVGLLAPMAVEHLGKAVLWRNNPVRLVQLDEKDESSLFTLATNPHLGAAIRTITLRQVLNRAEKVLGGPPQLIKSRKTGWSTFATASPTSGRPATSRDTS